jgi:transitional endoplasmic reticulum ATPase
MSSSPDPIQALRAALSVSPDNIPLRQHLADTLLSQGELEAAEREYAQALALDPKNPQIKLGLGRCFYQQGKDAQALVILEDLLKQEQTSASLTLYARLLLRSGNVEKAVQQFRLALGQDASLQASDLAEQLGINAAATSDLTEGRVRADWASPHRIETQEIERPTIRFADVGGMEAVKEEIRLKIIYPLTHAEMYKAYGKAIGGGILMYGPPGCGKTHLARATAGEIQAGFIAVGLNDILDMWIGNSEKNLHDVFDQARRHAPCVLFFDEVDALAASRADLRQSAGRQVINQFLAELDGVQYANEGVLILAATNAPWHLDSAFRRPGRFDRILFVPPPDALARSAILRLLCKGKPIAEIDFDLIGKKTDQCSGADLKAVVDVAIEKKLQEAIKTGVPQPLTTKDLAKAAEAVKASTREWFSTARNYAIHANQDGTYDEILKYLKL